MPTKTPASADRAHSPYSCWSKPAPCRRSNACCGSSARASAGRIPQASTSPPETPAVNAPHRARARASAGAPLVFSRTSVDRQSHRSAGISPAASSFASRHSTSRGRSSQAPGSRKDQRATETVGRVAPSKPGSAPDGDRRFLATDGASVVRPLRPATSCASARTVGQLKTTVGGSSTSRRASAFRKSSTIWRDERPSSWNAVVASTRLGAASRTASRITASTSSTPAGAGGNGASASRGGSGFGSNASSEANALNDATESDRRSASSSTAGGVETPRSQGNVSRSDPVSAATSKSPAFGVRIPPES
mmetsp:Transcript_10162/g.30732  ORF Transcript_10162/g.30732 Transcript_10162/m.30732 type:complete len:307 (+) Transcript_10162:1070-1990(+)